VIPSSFEYIKAALSTWDEAARGTTHIRAGMPQGMAVRTSLSRNVAAPSPPKSLQQGRWMGDPLPRLPSGIAPSSGSLCARRGSVPSHSRFAIYGEYDTRFSRFCKGFLLKFTANKCF